MFREVGEKAIKCIDDGTRLKPIISSLFIILRQNSLVPILRRYDWLSRIVLDTVQSIEKACSNGPLEIMAGSLSIQAKTIVGFEKQYS